MSHCAMEDFDLSHTEEVDIAPWHVKLSRQKGSLIKRSITKQDTPSMGPLEGTASGSIPVKPRGKKAIYCGNTVYSTLNDVATTSNLNSNFLYQHIDSPVANGELWPNVSEGQRLRVLKDKHSTESFAQKLQAGFCWGKNTMLQSPVKIHPFHKNQSSFQRNSPDKNLISVDQKHVTETFEESSLELQKNNVAQNSVLDYEQHETTIDKSIQSQSLYPSGQGKKEGTKKKKRLTQAQKLPPQDSHVCLIDRREKEKWLQSETLKQSASKRCPPSLENDFPDLSSALQLLSKYFVRQECEETTNDQESKNSRGRRRQRKNQPRWKDPISVNLIDIIKKSTDTYTKISSSNVRRMQARDFESGKLGGNLLDSSNPIRKRGKHRENPPKKRLSKLKLVILNERCKKQEQRGVIMRMQEEANFLAKELIGTPSLNSVCEGLTLLQITEECSNDNKTTLYSSSQQEKQNVNLIEEIIEISNRSDQIPKQHYEDNAKDSETDDNIHSEKINETLQIIPNIIINETRITSSLHSRKFRDYCDNVRSSELDEAVTNLLRELYRFQDRHHQRDPIRAHAKRRFVLGIREVKKYLSLKKIKAIVIAPDLEQVKSPGGLDETIVQIREEGRTQQIPVIFAVGRRQLGYAMMKKVPVSIIGIMNPEGAEELHKIVLDQWRSAANRYQEKVIELCSSTESK